MRLLALLLALPVLGLLASPAAARDPVNRSVAPAPDGTPLCAEWVHDRHSRTIRGRRFATWHPPRDPGLGCAFGHEHGSNPRAFRFIRRAGMPAFGRTGAFTGREEAHAGFKVFVAGDDRRGLSWMIVLHQGSGSPRRGTVRFHSVELWLFRRRDRRLIAHTRHMADFGPAVANCPGAPAPRSRRLLPHPGCPSAYEQWDTWLDVGGVLRGSAGFGIANPLTRFDPLHPARVIPDGKCAGGTWEPRCAGDRRVVLRPGWRIRNRGPARFRTDAYGRRAARGIPQFVSRRVRVRHAGRRSGPEDRFVVEQPSDGGIYRSGRGLRAKGFAGPGYCVLRAN